MKIKEPNGATMTAEAQQWLGVLILVLSLFGLIFCLTRYQKTALDNLNLIVFSGMILTGAIHAWAGYRRKRPRRDP